MQELIRVATHEDTGRAWRSLIEYAATRENPQAFVLRGVKHNFLIEELQLVLAHLRMIGHGPF